MTSLLFLILILPLTQSFGHQAHQPTTETENSSGQILKQIKAHYERDIQSIFQDKCMDCHSGKTRFPWYYKWPIARQLIDSDVREAKSHLDLTDGFPFLSHGSPRDDLKAIAKVIAENEMPPWRYRVLHSDSKLTESEKEKIKAWTSAGLAALQ